MSSHLFLFFVEGRAEYDKIRLLNSFTADDTIKVIYYE